MKADVVVNFINFYTSVEEEDISLILDELKSAGLDPLSIDRMVEHLLPGCNCNDRIINKDQEDD